MSILGKDVRRSSEDGNQVKRARHDPGASVPETSTQPDEGANLDKARVCEDVPTCWICLESECSKTPLIQPCKCPRHAHSKCLARWQLQSAGTKRETHCEFCDSKLPDWRENLSVCHKVEVPAVMTVNFLGKAYTFEVQPGPDGYSKFTAEIKGAFGLPEDCDLNITFTCDEPNTDDWPPATVLTLQGPGAYDAAVHCASISAARRAQRDRPSAVASPTASTRKHSRCSRC